MVVKKGWTGRVYEDFYFGDIYLHPLGRTVLSADNVWFSMLTMNLESHPLRSSLCRKYRVWPDASQLDVHSGFSGGAICNGSFTKCNGQSWLG